MFSFPTISQLFSYSRLPVGVGILSYRMRVIGMGPRWEINANSIAVHELGKTYRNRISMSCDIGLRLDLISFLFPVRYSFMKSLGVKVAHLV